MKLMPASSARWMIRTEAAWSVSPQAPNIIAPRHRGLTCTPVRASGRCSMARKLDDALAPRSRRGLDHADLRCRAERHLALPVGRRVVVGDRRLPAHARGRLGEAADQPADAR